MRCSRHADQIATNACDLCGRFHCDACLQRIGEELFCPACSPAADAIPAPSRQAPAWPKVAGAAAAITLATLLLMAALSSRPDPPPAEVTRVISSADEPRMAAAFEALESAAISAETFRAEQGRAPMGWDDLVPDLLDEPPTDPWSLEDQPLRLTVPTWDSATVVLYSIGPDAWDDGGRAYSVETGRGDLVYFVR